MASVESTARVRLVPFEPAHLEQLKAQGAVEFMWNWMPDIPKGTSAEAYAAYIYRRQNEGTVQAFSFFRCSDGVFAGVANFEMMSKVHRRLRIANMWIPEPLRGTGVFASAQAELIARALDWGARRIGWIIPEEASAALRAVEKLGARREGVLRDYVRLAGGGWANMVVFSMLRDEAEDSLKLLQQR